MGKIKLIVEVGEDYYDLLQKMDIIAGLYTISEQAIANGTPYPTYNGWNLTNYGYECPNCKLPSKDASPFCPECGADLRGCEDD